MLVKCQIILFLYWVKLCHINGLVQDCSNSIGIANALELLQSCTTAIDIHSLVNTSWPRPNGCHFPDDIFKLILLNENVRVLIKIPFKFVPMGPINNIPALVQIMAWHRPCDKPLSEPMMISLLTHICATRPQ